MSTVELKEKIEALNEGPLLEQLLGIIELESMKSEVFKIPESHKAGIEVGLQQIKDGQTKTHEEIMAKYKSWA